MSQLKTNNVQIGQSVTASNNFTLYQPAVPDGTVRIGVGSAGATTLDAVTVTNAGNVSLPGNLTVGGVVGAVGGLPSFQCRAWVNFNGAGTVTVRGQGNISSITDNGVGDYYLNFETAMPDTNYAAMGSGDPIMTNDFANGTYTLSNFELATTRVRIKTNWYNGTAYDNEYIAAAVFR